MSSSRNNNSNNHSFGSSSSSLTSSMSLGQPSFTHIEHAGVEFASITGIGIDNPTSRTSSSPIDIPTPRRSASMEAEAGSQPFSWDRPGNNEALDFNVDDSIARRTRAEMHHTEAEADSESADNWSTRANAGDDDDDDEDSGYSSHEGTELWGHGGTWPFWSMEGPFASSWSYTSRRLPGSLRTRRRIERNSPPPPPPPPPSSPVPATEGRREHYRVVPLVEADDTDGFEVPWIPLIGRIEDLLSWPVGSPRSARRGMTPVVAEEEEED
ncbi:hypothetical protein ABEF95_007142 [Exophiala dermatitidis]